VPVDEDDVENKDLTFLDIADFDDQLREKSEVKH